MTTFAQIRPAPRVHRSPAASTLAATMMVVAAVVAFLTISVLVTSQFGRYSGRQNGDSDEMAACDAALDYAFAQWKTAVGNAEGSITPHAPSTSECNPGGSTTLATAFNTSYSSGFASGTNVSCTNLQIYYTDQNGQPSSVDSTNEPTYQTGGTPTGLATQNVPGYPGWSGTTYYYVAVAEVTAAGHFGNPIPVSACRFFQVTRVPLFQAAIFYENKLEIHPGAPMIVTGLVHTNGDMWARSFEGLQFKSNVSHVGAYNEIGDATLTKGWDGNGGGWIPGVNNGVNLTGVPMNSWSDGKTTGSSTTQSSQLNQVTAIDPFGGASTNNNGLHDIVEVPATTNTSNQIAYNNASLRIVINDTVSPTVTTTVGTTTTTTANPLYITMTDKSGASIPFSTTAGSTYNNVYNALNAYPTTNVNTGSTSLVQSIQDLREASTVTLTSVDMVKLATATSAVSSSTGVVYIHYAARPASNPLAANQRQAIRLYDGGKLNQNVTIATDNGLYIQGDYNVGSTTYTDVPSNQTGASTYANGSGAPQVSGYTRYSTAVMADAVTILSNGWKDTNSSNTTLSSRAALPTTVNTAILAGDVASNSTTGYASGGAHNFPRFLEDWGSVNFTYYGSLVEAFHSQSYVGLWHTGNVYNWPNRMWNFDVNFLSSPVPGGVAGLQFSRGRWQRIQINANT